MKLRFLASLLSLFILVNVNFASTTGKISGQIKDSRTGEVLIGVNVIVDGTTLGAATDIDVSILFLMCLPELILLWLQWLVLLNREQLM